MPSLADNIVLFILALLLFGPKRLPQLAREVGKWVGEFRRASADFRFQMEDELRVSEQADKQKKIDALVAANPAANPALIPEPTHPHTPVYEEAAVDAHAPLTSPAQPIATEGELSIMPPATGLPLARAAAAPRTPPAATVSSLIDAIPEAPATGVAAQAQAAQHEAAQQETAPHA